MISWLAFGFGTIALTLAAFAAGNHLYGFAAGRAAERKLRLAGLQLTPEEIEASCALPDGVENAADAYCAAMMGYDTTRAVEFPPGHPFPLLNPLAPDPPLGQLPSESETAAMRAYLELHADRIAQIHAATRVERYAAEPGYTTEPDYLYRVMNGRWKLLQAAKKLLQLDAYVAALDSDVERSLRSIEALAAMAHVREPYVMGYMVRASILNGPAAAVEVLLSLHQLDASTLSRLERIFEGVLAGLASPDECTFATLTEFQFMRMAPMRTSIPDQFFAASPLPESESEPANADRPNLEDMTPEEWRAYQDQCERETEELLKEFEAKCLENERLFDNMDREIYLDGMGWSETRFRLFKVWRKVWRKIELRYGPALDRLEFASGRYAVGMTNRLRMIAAQQVVSPAELYRSLGKDAFLTSRRSGTLVGIWEWLTCEDAARGLGAAVLRTAASTIAHNRAALLAVRIEKLRAETGMLPRTLEEFHNGSGRELLQNPFTGADPHYRTRDESFAVLYKHPATPDRFDFDFETRDYTMPGIGFAVVRA